MSQRPTTKLVIAICPTAARDLRQFQECTAPLAYRYRLLEQRMTITTRRELRREICSTSPWAPITCCEAPIVSELHCSLPSSISVTSRRCITSSLPSGVLISFRLDPTRQRSDLGFEGFAHPLRACGHAASLPVVWC